MSSSCNEPNVATMLSSSVALFYDMSWSRLNAAAQLPQSVLCHFATDAVQAAVLGGSANIFVVGRLQLFCGRFTFVTFFISVITVLTRSSRLPVVLFG